MIQKETLALTVPAKRDSPDGILVVKNDPIVRHANTMFENKTPCQKETFSFLAILLRIEYTGVWSVRFSFSISQQGHHTL